MVDATVDKQDKKKRVIGREGATGNWERVRGQRPGVTRHMAGPEKNLHFLFPMNNAG